MTFCSDKWGVLCNDIMGKAILWIFFHELKKSKTIQLSFSSQKSQYRI